MADARTVLFDSVVNLERRLAVRSPQVGLQALRERPLQHLLHTSHQEDFRVAPNHGEDALQISVKRSHIAATHLFVCRATQMVLHNKREMQPCGGCSLALEIQFKTCFAANATNLPVLFSLQLAAG